MQRVPYIKSLRLNVKIVVPIVRLQHLLKLSESKSWSKYCISAHAESAVNKFTSEDIVIWNTFPDYK